MREFIYVFRKRYGGKLDVTQVSFQDYLDLSPDSLISTGKWAEIRLAEFIDKLMERGTAVSVSRRDNPDVYKKLKGMYDNIPDFSEWTYDNALKIKKYILITREDKELNPVWYIPKEERYVKIQ